jgi:hypothetical protein
LAVLAPEVTGGVVVAYLAEGRLKLPKSTPVFDIGDEEVTDAPEPVPAPAREQLPPPANPAATVSAPSSGAVSGPPAGPVTPQP